MKMKFRKGSTLALTLIIFAVLLIFATFLVGFTVTENKQAIYYQNKTQSYYIAKSGVEVIEKVLKDELNKLNLASDFNDYVKSYENPKEINVSIDNIEKPIIVKYEKLNDENVLTIKAKADYRGIEQTVKKALYVSGTIETEKNLSNYGGSEKFIFLGDEKDTYEKLNNHSRYLGTGFDENGEKGLGIAVKGDSSSYPVKSFIDNTDKWSLEDNIANNWKKSEGIYKIDKKKTYGEEGKTTDIYVNGSLLVAENATFKGDVNIYIRNNLVLESNGGLIGDSIKLSDEKDDDNPNYEYKLNIYVYNEPIKGVENTISLKTADFKTSDLKIVGNIFVAAGDIKLIFKKDASIDGNLIYYGDKTIEFSSDDNGNNKGRMLYGSIYAPKATVELGFSTNKVEQTLGGKVIADKIQVYANTSGKADSFYKDTRHNIIIPTPGITEIDSIGERNYGGYYYE